MDTLGPTKGVLIFQVSLYDKAPFGTIARYPDYAGVHIKCPDSTVLVYIHKYIHTQIVKSIFAYVLWNVRTVGNTYVVLFT